MKTTNRLAARPLRPPRPARAAVMWAVGGLAVLAGHAAAAPEAPEEQAVTLVLQAAAEARTPVTLDLTMRGGRFDEDVWATAYGYNLSQHAGTVSARQAAGGRVRLSVRLTIEGDPGGPRGIATYDVDLARRQDRFTGSYTGTFIDRPVEGSAAGVASQPLVRAVPGCKPPAAGEHPRLIFRKADLAELRRRQATPEGRAILAMLEARSPLRHPSQVSDRRASWMAANWGAIWQLTGQKDAPRKARDVLMNDVIAKPMPGDRKDIHHATRLLGIALAYDLCHDAWDAEFRQLVAEYIHVAALDLADGRYQGFCLGQDLFDPTAWAHRNAVRMACVGCAGIAILGDAGASGRALGEVERLVRRAERHVVTYLLLGIDQSGCGLEGPFYKDFALANGVLQFVRAARVALGRDLSGVNRFLLAGNVAGAALGDGDAQDFGLASISIQASGLWPMGIGSVPRDLLPAMKWCLDRDVGLAGKRHFGCAYPYQAAYALAGYPFGLSAKSPAEALPLLVLDPVQGHFLFRNRWQDADDTIVEVYLNLQSRPRLRLRSGDLTSGVLNVTGLGRQWLSGFLGPSRLNDVVGPELLYARAEGKQAFVGADLTRLYTVEPPRPGHDRRKPGAPFRKLPAHMPTIGQIRDFLAATRPAGQGLLATQPAPEAPADKAKQGIRLVRHVAVDFSGACGAPALIVIVDRCQEVPHPWRIPLRANVARSAAGQFVAGDADGANLAAWIASPHDARLSGGRIAPAKEFFVVLTLQRGTPPPARIEAAGLGAKVTLGGRTIAFDGRRIVFGK